MPAKAHANVAPRILLMVVSTVLALLVAEIVVRLVLPPPSRYPSTWHLESADKRFGVDLYPSNPRGYFPLDLRTATERQSLEQHGVRNLSARISSAPYAVPFEYSMTLCRAAAVPPRHKRRVVVIGDSFTEGQGVRDADTAVSRLSRGFPDAEFVNCGRRGYDFPALSGWFDRQLALEPDIVLYAMILNDPQQSEAFHARQQYLDDWIMDRRRTVSEGDGSAPFWSSHLWLGLADRLESRRVGDATMRWYSEMVGPSNAEGWSNTLDQIARMDAVMRARGGKFAVVLWPLMVHFEGQYPFVETHRVIGQALAARHIEFHDTLPAFSSERTESLWVHPVDHHPNERAQDIFAREVEPFVRGLLAVAPSS